MIAGSSASGSAMLDQSRAAEQPAGEATWLAASFGCASPAKVAVLTVGTMGDNRHQDRPPCRMPSPSIPVRPDVFDLNQSRGCSISRPFYLLSDATVRPPERGSLIFGNVGSQAIADQSKAYWTGGRRHLPVAVWPEHETANGAWKLRRRRQPKTKRRIG
jgi:hypothetical protein